MSNPEFPAALHAGAREIARRALELTIPTLESADPSEQAAHASLMLEAADAMLMARHLPHVGALFEHMPLVAQTISFHFSAVKRGALEGI